MVTVPYLQRCTGFQWDEGNRDKNWEKHEVTNFECEQIFFCSPLVVRQDKEHSLEEARYYALGTTIEKRNLFVVFTIRENLIRVISARDMTEREEKVYKR